jgi:hypothetical protein
MTRNHLLTTLIRLAVEDGGRKSCRPSFNKSCDRARYRQGRCAPPLAVAYGKP